MNYSILKSNINVKPEIKNLVHINDYFDKCKVNFYNDSYHIENKDHFELNLDNDDIIIFKDTKIAFNTLASLSKDILRDNSCIIFFPFDNSIDEITGLYSAESFGYSFITDSRGMLSLNGSSDYLKLMTTDTELNEYSINVWFRDNGSDDYAHILVAEDQNLFYFKYWESHELFYVGNSTIGSILTSNNSLLKGEIAMLTLTYSNELIKLYKNGELVQSVNDTFNMPATTYKIGNYNAEYGKQDEANLRIFNKELAQEEIRKIFEIEREQFGL